MPYLTLAQAARRRGCSLQTVFNRIRRGELKAYRPPGARGLCLDEAELIASGFIKPAAVSAVAPEVAAELALCGFSSDVIAGLAAADNQTLALVLAIAKTIVQRCAAQTSEGMPA